MTISDIQMAALEAVLEQTVQDLPDCDTTMEPKLSRDCYTLVVDYPFGGRSAFVEAWEYGVDVWVDGLCRQFQYNDPSMVEKIVGALRKFQNTR